MEAESVLSEDLSTESCCLISIFDSIALPS
jgi:hypothetical protein